ncbi:hypothetical protein [Anaerococcus kampingiae]|uniref:Uncharacterized protein n=1 Tax=Anaerococcus kampingae TaxID=3115614 RepID=A0ABW9MB55_9FIRM
MNKKIALISAMILSLVMSSRVFASDDDNEDLIISPKVYVELY